MKERYGYIIAFLKEEVLAPVGCPRAYTLLNFGKTSGISCFDLDNWINRRTRISVSDGKYYDKEYSSLVGCLKALVSSI